MEDLEQVKKDKRIEKLEERGATLPCPRCGNESFSLLDGYFNHPVQTKSEGIVFGGSSVPTIVLVCTKCGFLSEHALGVLGLLGGRENDE